MKRLDIKIAAAPQTFSIKRVGILTSCGLIFLGLALGAVGVFQGPSRTADTERAIALYVGGLDALGVGDMQRGRVLLEGACQLGHEPSCQEVWLRVDMEVAELSARDSLELTAQHVADGTEGVYFLYEDKEEESVTVRVYCPVAQHEQLSVLLKECAAKAGS